MEIIDSNKYLNAPRFDADYRRMTRSDSKIQVAIGSMMLTFLDALRAGIAGPKLFATKVLPNETELWLDYSDGYGNRAHMTATIDFKDHSSLVDGVPLLHYRLSSRTTQPPQAAQDMPIELRTRDVNTAYEFVVEAIRRCKPL
ncbi:MAG: hypothetical protein LLG00_04785 [Planctomycetaceae bacterium]|nr:hypothetical protein [Planctomycetaceae bacterium]